MGAGKGSPEAQGSLLLHPRKKKPHRVGELAQERVRATCLDVLEVENSQIPSLDPKANSSTQVAVSRCASLVPSTSSVEPGRPSRRL